MVSSETLVVVVTVNFDVIAVLGRKFFHHRVDVVHALSTFAHGLG